MVMFAQGLRGLSIVVQIGARGNAVDNSDTLDLVLRDFDD